MNGNEAIRPKTARTPCNASFGPRRMLKELGPLSSHPAYAGLKLLIWSAVALAPLVAGLLVLAMWLRDGSIDPTRFLINHGRTIALYGLATAGFAMGFGFTAFAAATASRSRMLAADNDVQRGPVLTVIAMLFLLGIATWGIPLITPVSTQTRLLMAWIGLLPLTLLLSLATFLPHEDSAGKLVKRPVRLWALVFPAAVIAFVIATRLKTVSEWLEQVSLIQVPLKVLVDAAGSSGLEPAAIESMKSWFLTGIIGVVACPLLSLALAAMSLSRRAVSGVLSGGEADSRGADGWRAGLLTALGVTQAEDITNEHETALHAAIDDPSGDFFAETPITVDQAAALHLILSLRTRSDELPPTAQPKVAPSADVILEGPDGSGRTATVVAALLQGALVTGDTAIVLVAQESKRDAMLERLRRAAHSLSMEGFIGLGALTPEAVSQWADPNAHASNGVSPTGRRDLSPNGIAISSTIPPRILVGTLEEMETAIFGLPYGFDAIERLLNRLDTVVIDDLDGFEIQDRLHLPYVLAKLRVILTARGQSLRTMLTLKPVADAARQLITRQLLKAASADGHWMRMRSMPRPPNASVSITALPSADGDASALDLLAACGRACRLRGLNVVVVAPFASQTNLSELLARCHDPGESIDAPLVSAVSAVDALPTLGFEDHALVGPVASELLRLNESDAFVVTWKSGDLAAVVFHMRRDAGGPHCAKLRHPLMVLPGKGSESLFAQHFASASRFIARLQLIPRTAFSAMGFPAAGTLSTRLSQYRQQPNDMVALVDRVIHLDPPDDLAALASNDPVRWSACSVAEFGNSDPPGPRHVAIRGLLPSSMGIMADPSGTTVTLLEPTTVPATKEVATHPRTVIWRSPDGSELARDDLAYLHSFCLRSEQQWFCPTRMQAGSPGPVIIDARPVSSRQGLKQPAMPAFEIAALPIERGTHLRRLLQSAPLAHRVAIFGIVPMTQQESAAGKNSAAAQTATLRLIGLYDYSANLREWELRTSYEAAKFFVLFDPPANKQSAESLNEYFLVDWGPNKPTTHEDFPELAAAITEAMRWQAPGLERLVRCLGFRIRRQDSSPLVGLVFVEPRSTESSGFAIMEPIVFDLEVMHEFFDRAAGILEQAAGSETPAAVLYAAAGIAMNPRAAGGRLTVDLDAIKTAAALLRSIAADARDFV
jgi:hypothetical protein